MPIFEFSCQKCGYIFEKIERNNIIEITTECPNCNNIAKKIISSSNFVVKGYSAANNYSKKEK